MSDKVKPLSAVSFGSTFDQINERVPQPREMLIRQGSDFGLPLKSASVHNRCHTHQEEGTFEQFSPFCLTQKSRRSSQVRRSEVDKQTVISKGVRVTKQ